MTSSVQLSYRFTMPIRDRECIDKKLKKSYEYNLGVWPELFSWSSSCNLGFCQTNFWKQVSWSKLYFFLNKDEMKKVSVCCQLVESGCLPLHYIKLVSLFRVAGEPRLRQQRLPTSGTTKPARLVIASYSNRTVAHSVLTGTVPNNYCQSVGSDFTDVTPQKI